MAASISLGISNVGSPAGCHGACSPRITWPDLCVVIALAFPVLTHCCAVCSSQVVLRAGGKKGLMAPQPFFLNELAIQDCQRRMQYVWSCGQLFDKKSGLQKVWDAQLARQNEQQPLKIVKQEAMPFEGPSSVVYPSSGAAAAAVAALAGPIQAFSGWVEQEMQADGQNVSYYYNVFTQQTQYDEPAMGSIPHAQYLAMQGTPAFAGQQQQQAAPQAAGTSAQQYAWVEHWNAEYGLPYYSNTVTQETVWEPPAEPYQPMARQ